MVCRPSFEGLVETTTVRTDPEMTRSPGSPPPPHAGHGNPNNETLLNSPGRDRESESQRESE